MTTAPQSCLVVLDVANQGCCLLDRITKFADCTMHALVNSLFLLAVRDAVKAQAFIHHGTAIGLLHSVAASFSGLFFTAVLDKLQGWKIMKTILMS